MSERDASVIVKCACCGKSVVAVHKSKNRTCSKSCYFKLYRKKKRLEQIEREKALKAAAVAAHIASQEQPETPQP